MMSSKLRFLSSGKSRNRQTPVETIRNIYHSYFLEENNYLNITLPTEYDRNRIGIVTDHELIPDQYFIHIVSVDNILHFDDILTFLKYNPRRLQPKLNLTYVSKNWLDTIPHIHKMIYSRYHTHVMIQNGGTCYYHAAINVIIFNPYFRKFFYDHAVSEGNEDDSGIEQLETGTIEFINNTSEVSAEKRLISLIKPFFKKYQCDIGYNQNLKIGGAPLIHMLYILSALFHGRMDKISVDNFFQESLPQEKYPEWWVNTEDFQTDEDVKDVYITFEVQNLKNFWVTSVLILLEPKNGEGPGHAVTVFRDENNGFCLVDSNYKIIYPLKNWDVKCHQNLTKTNDDAMFLIYLRILLEKVYNNQKIDVFAYIMTRKIQVESKSFLARGKTFLPVEFSGRGGGRNSNMVYSVLGLLLTLTMSFIPR